MTRKLLTIFLLFLLSGCSQVQGNKENLGVNTLKIDGREKTINYTDDNTGENLIIKSDNKDYIGFGGDSYIFFSITNNSGSNQTVNIIYSLPDKVSIKETDVFSKNEIKNIKVIPATATSSKQTLTKEITIWNNLALGNPTIDSKTQRKSIKDRISKNGLSDTINVGQTKYYRALINIPTDVSNDEFFIEAFGSNAYGHLDPNLWTYSQNFNSLTDGEISGQDGWAYVSFSGASVQTTNSPYPDPTSVKHVFLGTSTIGRDSLSAVSGTFYYSMKGAATEAYGNGYFWNEVGDMMMVRFDGTGNLKAFNGHDVTTIGSYTANTYHRIGIQFETGSGGYEGLSADTYKVSVDNGAWSSALSFYDPGTAITKIQFYSAGDANMWVDFIDPNYATTVATTEFIDESTIINFE